MKKHILFVLALLCILNLGGCNNKPEFKDFAAYEEDFSQVRDFIATYNLQNGESPHIVDINGEFLTVDGNEISDSSLSTAVNRLHKKGFAYIEVNSDCLIFWDDETGYYGILWSENPREAIRRIVKESRPNMKRCKLSDEWYEVGALGAI